MKSTTSEQTLVSTTINLCNMENECKRGNIFAKTLCALFDKSANFIMKCPFKKVN